MMNQKYRKKLATIVGKIEALQHVDLRYREEDVRSTRMLMIKEELQDAKSAMLRALNEAEHGDQTSNV